MNVPYKPLLCTSSYSQRHSLWGTLMDWLFTRAAFHKTLPDFSVNILDLCSRFDKLCAPRLCTYQYDSLDCLVARTIMAA